MSPAAPRSLWLLLSFAGFLSPLGATGQPQRQPVEPRQDAGAPAPAEGEQGEGGDGAAPAGEGAGDPQPGGGEAAEGEPGGAEAAEGEPGAEAAGGERAAGAAQAAQEAADADEVPWAQTEEFEPGTLPAFLDTTDVRIVDDRPPPTPEQVAALEQLEREVERFAAQGGAYRDTVVSIVRRQYLRHRRAKNQNYLRQIRAEEELEDEARAHAIELFERFIERYPGDPEYTPDAMFRLGELYFERDAIAFQRRMDRFMEERDERLRTEQDASDLQMPTKAYAATIDLYRDLVQRFGDYERLDGVYYLIGYCLNEMGEAEEAQLAWLNLVCANRFSYEGRAPEREVDPAREREQERLKQHPALGLEQEGAAEEPGEPFVDPYADCKPVVEDSRFYAETWLRIGEYHFDQDFSQHGLERAISAYNKVLQRPEDRNYNLALYKVAWTYYRAGRYPEAMEHFWKLVQWSEEEKERTGKGSELRDEAIQYLGIGFAYDDWNENQVPDPEEGLPRGIARVQDASLLPQDRPWTPDVYFRLGDVYFEEAKYPQAVEAWKLALERWPLHRLAPQIQNMVARAYTRNKEMEAAVAARAKLSDYGEGTDWWEANKEHPLEQRQAEKLAEQALINTAIMHHQAAQGQRRRCVENQDPQLCRRAQEQYALAAQAYREYVKRYPNNPQAYELQYNLADTLYWSENYEEAARVYAAVRDSNLDDKFLSEAARLVVESMRRLVDKKQEAGAIAVREEPPQPAGTPPEVRPLKVPLLLQRLARAREMYLARVPEQQDRENVREVYRFNNALLLYLYGYWEHARQRFAGIYDERCVGPNADHTGRVAWINLRNMAVALDEVDEVTRLGTDLRQRQCTFSPDGMAAADVDCDDPDNKDEPACLAGADLTNLRYREAVEIFKQAETAEGDTQRRLYERAATELVRAVNEEPNHPQAPLALEKAAIALERTSRFESAGRLYQRIIDEVGPRKAEDDEEQKSLDAILGNAYFRLAFNANRFFDFDRAVENYRILADSERFARSQDPDMRERREGALINAAKILEYQQQYGRAAEYYRRAAEMLSDPEEVRAAHYRVAEMAYKQKQWKRVISEMQAFIDRYRGDQGAGELVVQAHWRIAQAREARREGRRYQAALDDVVSAFQRSGQEPGSMAAEYAAEAKFILADEGTEQFDDFEIKVGRPATLEAYVKTVTRQIESGAKEAKRMAEAYNPVPAYGRPTWTIAAFVRQGRIYEILARAVLNTEFVVPRDMRRKMRGLPPYAQDDIKIQVEDKIRQVLDAKVRPIECLAVARYALAARAARAGNIDDEYTRQSIDRINAYGDERIAECVAQAAAQDATFRAYQPGEFSRAPRGINLDIPENVTPPPLGGME